MPRNLSRAERANIIALHNEGFIIRQISRRLNVPRQAVRLWITRDGEEGNLNDRHRSGRRREISDVQREMMRREYDNGFVPTKYFATMFDVTAQTIRNHLHYMGLHYRHYAKKIDNNMTENHKQARLNFARQHLDFDWSNTVFCDEKTFKSSQHGRLHLWRRDGTRYTQDHVIPNKESGRISVNIYGWMTADEVGELCCMPPRARALDYVDVLHNSMLPSVRTFYPENEMPQFNYCQDNSSLHKALVTRAWFDAHPEIR